MCYKTLHEVSDAAYCASLVDLYMLPLTCRWAVKCCKTAGICLTECRLSDPINNLGDAIDYCADDGNVFVGVYSSFFSV